MGASLLALAKSIYYLERYATVPIVIFELGPPVMQSN